MDLEKIFQDLIIQRYEKNPVEENNLVYHNWQHTQNVLLRALGIEDILVGFAFMHERDIDLLKFSVLGHDLVQEFVLEDASNGIGKGRKRNSKNEEKSAQETIKIIKEHEVLAIIEEEKIKEAILITTSAWDEEYHTNYQPNLRTVPGALSLCVAFADLGVVGMKSEENIVEVGNLLFKEERLLPKTKTLDRKQKDILQKEILDWNYKELLYCEGRKKRFQIELNRVANISWKMVEEINKLFSEFNKNIELEKEHCEKCKKLTFKELIKVFGIE